MGRQITLSEGFRNAWNISGCSERETYKKKSTRVNDGDCMLPFLGRGEGNATAWFLSIL